MTEIINVITERMEQYMDEITDCNGDHAKFEGLKRAIEEDEFVLNLLSNMETISKTQRHKIHGFLARLFRF